MENKLIEKETSNTELIVHSDSMFFDTAKFMLAQRVAKVFASSDMVPIQFKNNIPNCIIGLNLADRMGVDPFMLFQNMYIVHGNPGIEAKLAIALTNGCGRFEPLQFKHENKNQGDNWGCVAYAKDIKSGKVLESATVSIKIAKDEGWYNKSGSKWKTMPELMLEYRSAMFFARVYCPEVLLGLKTREEIYDIVDLERGENGTYGTTPEESLTEKLKSEPKKEKIEATDLTKEPEEGEPDIDPDIQAGQKLLEEIRAKEKSNKNEDPEIEKVDWIEWLLKPVARISIGIAKEWLRRYEENEDEIECLENRDIREELRTKKVKAKSYLASKEPSKKSKILPGDPPSSPGANEQDERRDNFVKYCREANSIAESDITQDVLTAFGYKTINDVPEIEFGTIKRGIDQKVKEL